MLPSASVLQAALLRAQVLRSGPDLLRSRSQLLRSEVLRSEVLPSASLLPSAPLLQSAESLLPSVVLRQLLLRCPGSELLRLVEIELPAIASGMENRAVA